jgi:hypothetical protein
MGPQRTVRPNAQNHACVLEERSIPKEKGRIGAAHFTFIFSEK